jgi:hypothetical protein
MFFFIASILTPSRFSSQFGDTDWTKLVQDMVQWLDLVNTVMDLEKFHKRLEISQPS